HQAIKRGELEGVGVVDAELTASKSVQKESEERVTPEQGDIEKAINAGLDAVDRVVRALRAGDEPLTCYDVGRVFDTAIGHAAPIWNRGSQEGCARIYLHAARELVSQL